MTVILKLEYASGILTPKESLTGLATRVPQGHLELDPNLITLLEIQVCH